LELKFKKTIQVLLNRLSIRILIGLFLGYLLFSYFVINPLSQKVIPWLGEKELASHLDVKQVEFDPLSLKLTLNKINLTQLDGSSLASIDRLTLNFEIDSLIHFAWHMKDMEILDPKFNLDIDSKGKFNWSDLITRLNEKKDPNDQSIPRVLIDHFLISKGSISYSDRNRSKEIRVTIEPIHIELDELSTLPKDRGQYVLFAKLAQQDGIIKWKGNIGLNPLASKGVVDIEALKISKVLEILKPVGFPLAVSSGLLNTNFNYDFFTTQEKDQLLPSVKLSNVNIKLSDFGSKLPKDQNLKLVNAELKIPTLNYVGYKTQKLDINDAYITLSNLSISNASQSLFRLLQADIKGINYSLVKNHIDISALFLDQGEIHSIRDSGGNFDWQKIFDDASKAPVESQSSQIGHEKKPFKLAIQEFKLQHWKADFIDKTFKDPIHAQAQDINLSLSLIQDSDDLNIKGFNAEIRNTTLQSMLNSVSILTVNKINLNDGVFNLRDKKFRLAQCVLTMPETSVTREKNGSINLEAAFESSYSNNHMDTSQSKLSPWSMALDKLVIQNVKVHFQDKTLTKPIQLDLQNGNVELNHASLDLSKPVDLTAKFSLAQGGQFNALGKVKFSPLNANFQVKLDELGLKTFSPYVNQYLYLHINDGKFGIFGNISLQKSKELKASFVGKAMVANLEVNEDNDNISFLKWKSLASSSVKLDLNPNKLHLNDLKIEDLKTKFIIHEDKTFNITRFVRATSSSIKVVPNNADNKVSSEVFPVAIDRLVINNGDLEFADLSLKPQFGTQINTLTGVINGLSTNPNTAAQIELDGKVDEFGSASIRGSIQPFRASDFTDLKLIFSNLEMSRLTPYSGKFAGRKIDSGKLSVNLEYKIKQQQLSGENKFVLNQLKLGERVDSADAIHLPLDLAISILEDSNGVIDLDIPISGSLQDPKFSYGKLIWQAFINVLEKVATAPFHILGKLLGINSDKLGFIAFEPGKSLLAPPEQEKLKLIIDTVSKKHSLDISVAPTFNSVTDTLALQDFTTRKDILKEAEIVVPEGEVLGPLDLNNSKIKSAIENLMKDRKGEARNFKAVDILKNYFKKSRPEDVQVANNSFEQLKLTTPITEADLFDLAKKRAKAIADYIESVGGLGKERVIILEPTKYDGGDDSVKLKLSLVIHK